MRFRTPRQHELTALTELCLRSKAHWGYDADFLAACRRELMVTPRQLETDALVLADDNRGLIGVGQVSVSGETATLEKLFVEPYRIGDGCGVLLYEWALRSAADLGAARLVIDADPGAEGFYLRMGAKPAGEAPSHSIPGRVLPRLIHTLQDT